MNKKSIYGIIAVAVIAIFGLTVGCSDNIDADYDPISAADRTLTLNGSLRDSTINITAGAAHPVIKIQSNTRWTVRVVNGGGWCTTDVMSGKGNESFTINILENLGEDERTCTVEVSAVDAEGQEDSNKSLQKTITIIQEKSSVRISPSSLEAFPAIETSMSFDIYANAVWTLSVSYENESTPEFITVTPGENMTRTGDGIFEGNTNAKFSITVANNGSDASRLGYLNLVSEVGKYTVEIRQNKSEYTFDVSPAVRQTVAPQGGTIRFDILSHSEWTVSCADQSVTFSPASGQGTGQESTIATFEPNMTDTIKTMRIRFEPKKENYVPQEVIVEQQAFKMTFSVSHGSLPGIVYKEGGDYTVNVSSMFDWVLADTPDWIEVTPKEGKRSENTVTLKVEISPNNNNERVRDGLITVIPLETQFYDNIYINPESVKIQPFDLPFMQYGGQQPAVSVPWVSDGIKQKQAELTFNYYSPNLDIVSAGIEYKEANAEKWSSTDPIAVNDPKSGTVVILLSGLDPMKKYVARGYIIDKNGKSYSGSATETFTTAGQLPGSGDNPTPTR